MYQHKCASRWSQVEGRSNVNKRKIKQKRIDDVNCIELLARKV